MLLSLISSVRRSAPILALAVAAGPAVAQPAALVARATPQVLGPGQSAQVDVLARLPGGAYAVASSAFGVHATAPGWLSADSGFIAAGHVLGASFSQPHLPGAGVFADPADPLRIWSGTYRPASPAPALVEIRPGASAFSIYPSRLTPSAIPLDPAGIAIRPQLVFVNPAPVGRWLAAPGERTAIGVHDDVIVDGRIITGENPAAILIGLLLPAVQSGRDNGVRIEFDQAPDSFSATAHAQRGPIPVDQFSLNFTKVTFERSYEVRAEFPAAGPISFTGFQGGVRVAAGDVDGQGSLFRLAKIPQVVRSSAGPRIRVFDGRIQDVSYGWTLRFDAPVQMLLSDGSVRAVDTVEVRGRGTTNNLKQIGLACHVFESTGASLMRLIPSQR